ncbi:MAG: dihydrofolate reductase [Chloroflexi bacterium HGW-Chloroflexi-5]|nr:MAG: dihydrofolate reductase [Chloroflexi bacterium HGW-Chloroflexi-5]
MSADGYIAKPNDDLSFLSMVQQDGEDYGYADFLKSVDTVIMGRKTYDWVMTQLSEFPHADLDSYIITRSVKPDVGKTKFYTGNLKELVSELKNKPGKNIFVDGGAEIVNELMKENLIDAFIISVIPIFVGSGTRLFNDGRPEQKLEIVRVKRFDTGLVQLHYKLVGTD